MTRARALSTLLLPIVLAALPLAGCKPAAPDKSAEAAKSAPQAKPGVSVSAARLVLPAVKGNPGAAYFTLDNSGSGTVALAAISIEGTNKVEIHQTSGSAMSAVSRIDIAPGTHIALAPGGLHAMVFGLDPKLTPGASAEMTLTFADGDKLSAPLELEAAGSAEAMDDMPGMGGDSMGAGDHH